MSPSRVVVRARRLRVRVERELRISFRQPLGERVPASGVEGYYLDMRVKAKDSSSPTAAWPWERGTRPWVGLTQVGLGAHERWLAGEGEEWLALAAAVADDLCDHQVAGGPRDGAWEHTLDYPHTFDLRAPWISGMAQGQAASLLVRTSLATGSERHAEAARRAVRLNGVLTEEGGALAVLDGHPFPQEYPTTPASHVLNGGIYAAWGWRDLAEGLGDDDARRRYEECVDGLAANLHRWDTGWWSRYDLLDRRPPNLASPAYHELHVGLLTALHAVSPRPQVAEVRDRFAAYAASRTSRVRALAGKAAFRARTPRTRHAAVRAEARPGG